jgi:hypothetical protein
VPSLAGSGGGGGECFFFWLSSRGKDLAKFDYKIKKNMKVHFFKIILEHFVFLATYLNHV